MADGFWEERVLDTSDSLRRIIMCRRLIYLISFVWILGPAIGVARADPYQQDPGPGGIVSIEAENFDENTPQGAHTWDFITSPAGFSGTGAMRAMPDSGTNNNLNYPTDSPHLDYEVKFVKTGTYYVWVRGYTVDGYDDSMHVAMDAIKTGGGDADRIQAGWARNTWQWSINRRENLGLAKIEVATVGVHVISVWMREELHAIGYRSARERTNCPDERF
jgi:hypothetical protein